MNYKVFLKAVLFSVLSALIATPLQVLNSMFILHQGRPESSFLIPIGIISITMKSLFAISYILMGQKLPIKNSHFKAFIFIAMIWISDYLPQIFGIAGADGPLAKEAFNISIVIFDVVFYGCLAITGVLLPIFYRLTEYNDAKTFSSKRFGIIYSLCIWAPVVVIVIAFGASISTTFLYVIVFSICILFVSLMNGRLLEYFNSNC